jgi:uncharacterized membrane protein HdeD (DUF308 family)
MTTIHLLLLGALAMATLTVAVIFLRHWRDSGERLFLYFALSFFVQAINRVALALTASPQEGTPWHYLLRLVAYLLIVWAIIDANRPRRGAAT